MTLIYLFLLLSLASVHAQFSMRSNWTFADLPSTTDSEKRFKCSRKLDFSCECRSASSMYDIGLVETEHPFCLTDAGKTHGACTGGCIDSNMKNYIGQDVDGISITVEAECLAITRTWSDPILPKCLNEKGEDMYSLGGGGECDSLTRCTGNSICKFGGTCQDCTETPTFNNMHLGAQLPDEGIAGKCVMPGANKSSTVDVTAEFGTKAACESKMTFVPPVRQVKKYYETSTYDATAKTFTANDNRQCIAGAKTAARIKDDECPINDPFCNQFPKISEIDIDSDNFNTMTLSATFTKIGELKRCSSRGAYDSVAEKYDSSLHPLAPCPLVSEPFYCDYPQNEMFGKIVNVTDNGTTTEQVLDTTCGVGKFLNQSRNSIGLPHGIREYFNGFDNEAFQWSIETEDPVSLQNNLNEILSEIETVQMNIFSVGKIIDKKFVLSSNREGVDEQAVNSENIMELRKFFDRLALSGDEIDFSDLKNKSEIHKKAEWSPIDLDADGKVSQFRCHSMPDKTITDFRQISDIRSDFIDKFFAANKEQDCKYGQPALDNETRSFKRCSNHNDSPSFLYPSTRKAFFNQIKSDGFFAGMSKGQRFIKEIAQSEDEIGYVDGGPRTLPDGTNVRQNATYHHMKMMMSMTMEQLDNCNTVTGSCRPTWNEFPKYRFNVKPEEIYSELRGSNASSFASCKMACFNDAHCGGFMYKARAGLQECNLVNATGKTFSGADYTSLRTTLLQDNAADDYTAVTLDRPDCLFRLLNTRYVNIETLSNGNLRDMQPHDDDITGFWGVGETMDKGSQHGFQTCRTSITIKKLGKIDADQVDLGLKNDIGETFIADYPYTIEINDEDCVNQVVEKEEAVSQATSAAVSLTEAEEMVKIVAATSPDWCRSDSGHYNGDTISSTDGGVCLSHKQRQRHTFANGSPFGGTVEKDAKCIDFNSGGTNKIAQYPHKKDCIGAGMAWQEARSFHHEGRAEVCTVNGIYSLHLHPNKTACEANDGVWTPAVPATHAFGFIADDDHQLMSPSCVDADGKLMKQHITVEACQAAGGTWNILYTSDDVPISYEDERLTCAHMDYPQAKHVNGPYSSKYDRIRMALYVDVLRLKDLYSEGKGASSIVPRGFPTGLVEGHTPAGGCKDCNIKEVGQHRITINDQDVVYYNPETEEECTIVEASDPETGCLLYSFATDYRASGIGETYRGETQQERDDRNQIRNIIGEYIVRDVGIDEASTELGVPFWKDELTTISFLGTATSSDEPLEESVQDIRENYGDGKIYSRYLIELFSDCLDRTQQQQHSSRLHFQTFKDGRLHADRIKDSLPEIMHGDYNEGFTKYDINASDANGTIILQSGHGILNTFRAGDLVTLSDCTTASDNGDYALKEAAYVEQTSSKTTLTVSKIAGQHECDADASSTTVTGATEADRQQACAAAAHAADKSSFSLARAASGSDYACVICETQVGKPANPNTADYHTFFSQTTVTRLGEFDYKATLTEMPTEPRGEGAKISRTIDATCKIAQRERQCDGYSYDIKTVDLLAKTSQVYDSFSLTTKDVCGAVEMDNANCGTDASKWADKGTCSNGAFVNRHACVTNGHTWVQQCKYLRPCGDNVPSGFGYDSSCTTPSENRCQICNYDTPTCYDSTKGPKADGKLPARVMSLDMQCAGLDFSNPNLKLGMTVKKIIPTLGEEITNLDFYDLPVEVQTYGAIYGAELVEFSVGFNLVDTIDFAPDQYLTLEGMGSRTEVIAWLKNNRIGEIESVRDVRDMGDLTYPQLTTEEVIFTVQSYDPNFDPELHNVHIESLSVCSHNPLTYFEPYIQLGKIHRNVVNCLVGKVNDGKDGYGNVLSATQHPEVQAGTDACQYVFETCPHKPNTGFSLKREEDNYFLLASYRPLYGQDGHLFIDDTCDILSITRLLDLLTLPDFGNKADNNIVYAYANNVPDDSNGVPSGDEAVKQACVKSGAPAPEDFFKKLGPQNDQVPVSSTIVRNFKSMLMKDAKELKRGVREVVPCRRLATHGDDLSPAFANAVLYGYQSEESFGSKSNFGDRFEPRNCWLDSFHATCTSADGKDVTSQYGDASVCKEPIAIDPISALNTKPRQCEPYKVGFGSGTPNTVAQTFNRFVNTDTIKWTAAECHQLCEDNSKAEFCEFRKQSEVCTDTTYTTKETCEANGEQFLAKGQCIELSGANAGITEDDEGQFLVTKCVDRSDEIKPSVDGYFSANTKAVSHNATTKKEAESQCATNPMCAGFHEIPAVPALAKCDSSSPFGTELVLVTSAQMASRGSLLKHDLDECMYQCAGIAEMTHIVFKAGETCTCKKVSGTCNPQQLVTIPDAYAIDVDVSTKKIDDARGSQYELFEIIDDQSIDTVSVKGANSKAYTKVPGCAWCVWENTQPRTHDDDSESCMTNVLQHIDGPTAFEDYLDSIGSSIDMEQAICVQKNNMYRVSGSKHISCPYNNLYNFDMDSVYAPEQFSITDEEKAYRLNPSSPAWDALIFHP